MKLSANEIARIVQLAFILEPVANKPGLTTRYSDRNTNLKLENFLVAGINLGDSFRELAERLLKCDELPITYDIALQAQKDSFKNRIGTRLVYGGIISLFPLIITQLRIKSTNPYEILDNVDNILKQTHKEDALYYQALENFAYSRSINHKHYMFEVKDDYESVWDYLEKDLVAIGDIAPGWSDRAKTGTSNKEILKCYPTVRRMLDIFYDNVRKDRYPGVSEISEEIYFLIRREFPNIHIQWLADLQVCMLYLIVSNDNTEFFV